MNLATEVVELNNLLLKNLGLKSRNKLLLFKHFLTLKKIKYLSLSYKYYLKQHFVKMFWLLTKSSKTFYEKKTYTYKKT